MLEIAALIGGLGHGFAYPLLSAMVIRDTPAGHGSRVSSIYMSMWDLSAMMGPFMLESLRIFAGYATMFVLAGTIAHGRARLSGGDATVMGTRSDSSNNLGGVGFSRLSKKYFARVLALVSRLGKLLPH